MPGSDWVPRIKQPLPICTLTALPTFPEVKARKKPLVVNGHVFKNSPWKKVAANKETRSGICIYCDLERYQKRYNGIGSAHSVVGYKEKGGSLVKYTGVKLPPCNRKEGDNI